jgi:hypothetical protein
MNKAVFVFKCRLDITVLNKFFRNKNIVLDYYNLNQKLEEYKFHVASMFLKTINPYLIVSIEVALSSREDYIIFYTAPMRFSCSGDQFVVMAKVPYMATPLITEIQGNSPHYELALAYQ